MTTAALIERRSWTPSPAATLNFAARLWFAAAVTGQWIFVAYIVGVYGRYAARGDFSNWNRSLPHGYQPGNSVGNAALAGHLLFAAVITLMGALQLAPQLRARFPSFHRWNGRIYMIVAFVMGLTGLYLSLSGRKLVGDAAQHLAIDVNGVLILVCAAMAWRAALARRFALHRQWALRLFMVVNGVWFFRVGLMFWLLINGAPVGFDPDRFTGPFLTALGIAQYLFPLGALELYLRAERSGSAPARFAVAGALIVLTIGMAAGIFAATAGMWLPKMTRV